MKPKKFDGASKAFGSSRIAGLLPPYEQAREYRGPFVRVVSKWFFDGLSQAEVASFVAKDGIDKTDALWHVSVCVKSFEPKHEHKMAGCAWLMAQWFEEPAAADPKDDGAK